MATLQKGNRMAQQSAPGNRPRLSEKGLLTPDNSVVALVDHQPQMLFGVTEPPRAQTRPGDWAPGHRVGGTRRTLAVLLPGDGFAEY